MKQLNSATIRPNSAPNEAVCDSLNALDGLYALLCEAGYPNKREMSQTNPNELAVLLRLITQPMREYVERSQRE